MMHELAYHLIRANHYQDENFAENPVYFVQNYNF